jgi:branched-chain amino acid aminotransferase
MKEIESWRNGVWIPNSNIGTNLWDAHYFFGWAVFEAIRTYNHVPFLLDEHIDRLYRSADLGEIKFDMSKAKMKELTNEVMEHNKKFFDDGEEYRIMIFISPGYYKIYDDMGDSGPIITVNVTTTSRYAKHVTPYLEKGYITLISSQRQIPSRFLDPKIKSCSRLHYGLADAEAARYGSGVVPILLDEHGYITESSGSNIAFVKDGKLCVPKYENILRGCTINYVEKIARDYNISVLEDNWEVYDITSCDGIIITSTFSGLTYSYNLIYRNKTYKLTGGEHVINNLIDGFSKGVGVDIIKQWKEWYDKKYNTKLTAAKTT